MASTKIGSKKAFLAQVRALIDKLLNQQNVAQPKQTRRSDSTGSTTASEASGVSTDLQTTTPDKTLPQEVTEVTSPTTDTLRDATLPDTGLSIAILGAGIAGLALAIGLTKRGVPCTVYDACEAFSAIGAGIGLGPNSLNAIDLLDPSFREKYNDAKTANERPEFKHSVFDALLAEEGFGANRGWHRGLVGAPYFERSSAHRKALLEIMASFIPAGTVQFSKRAVSVEQVGDKVEIRFADSKTAVADAVIGADGIRGITRKAVLGERAPDLVQPKYTGMYIYRGVLPMADAKEILGEHAGDAKWFMAKDRGLAIYPISKGAEANFVFFIVDPCKEWTHASGSNIACTKEDMLHDLREFDPRLRRLLDWAMPLRWPIFHHPQTPSYYKGRICMIGDCAHATSPHQASGAGMGLEDAVMLAGLLSLAKTRADIEVAYRVFDSVRRPRCTKVIATSEDAGTLYTFNNPDYGDDMARIVENANGRLHWIWQHDLKADQERAEAQFRALTRGGMAKDGSEASSSFVPVPTAVETKSPAVATMREVVAVAAS